MTNTKTKRELEEAADELVTAGLTISRLRAANKKLRAELEKAQHSASVYKEASKQNWKTSESYRRDVAEAMNVRDTWKEAFSQLAEAIGGKAK